MRPDEQRADAFAQRGDLVGVERDIPDRQIAKRARPDLGCRCDVPVAKHQVVGIRRQCHIAGARALLGPVDVELECARASAALEHRRVVPGVGRHRRGRGGVFVHRRAVVNQADDLIRRIDADAVGKRAGARATFAADVAARAGVSLAQPHRKRERGAGDVDRRGIAELNLVGGRAAEAARH